VALTAAGSASLTTAFSAAAGAMGEVLTSLAIGFFAYQKGILPPQALSAVSALTVSVLIPSLLGSKVCMTAARICKMGGVGVVLLLGPIFALLHCGLMLSFSGPILRWAGRDPASTRGRMMRVAMCWSNSALPVVFLEALFRSRTDSTLMLADGAVAFYLLGWSTSFWSGAFSILESAPALPSEQGTEIEGSAVPKQQANQPRWRVFLNRVLSPPVCGILAGLAVGTLPPLRWLFVEARHGSPYGPPLGPVLNGIQSLGRAAIPCSQMVLAGSLARSLEESRKRRADPDGAAAAAAAKASDGWNLKDVVVVVLARSILSPIISGYALVILAMKLGLIPTSTAIGRAFAFAMLCEATMPPPQNAVVIPNLLRRPLMAATMAELMLLAYSTTLPLATFWIALALRWTGV